QFEIYPTSGEPPEYVHQRTLPLPSRLIAFILDVGQVVLEWEIYLDASIIRQESKILDSLIRRRKGKINVHPRSVPVLPDSCRPHPPNCHFGRFRIVIPQPKQSTRAHTKHL